MTHTLGKDHDETWWVGRAEVCNDGTGPGTTIMLLFSKLSFGSALRLVNCLNGGEGVSGMDTVAFRAWELCAHG
jgi:hypothetical protein